MYELFLFLGTLLRWMLLALIWAVKAAVMAVCLIAMGIAALAGWVRGRRRRRVDAGRGVEPRSFELQSNAWPSGSPADRPIVSREAPPVSTATSYEIPEGMSADSKDLPSRRARRKTSVLH